jgi:hypothetical protein
MVAVLLSTLHPNAERIDGAGGDGGRDVQLRKDGRKDFFELKSHTGRVGKSQRAQIKRSLARAAERSPDSWTLVIPIDHNEDELKWFDKLKKDYSFPLHWSGLTWLDAQVAAHPNIPRYFLEGAAQEVIEILARLRDDESALAEGVEDVISRMEGWVRRLNEIDPFWGFDISRSPEGAYTIAPRPKYCGAEKDRPILIHFRGRFPTTEEGQNALEELQMAIDYGRPTTVLKQYVEEVTVDAPAGMGGTFQGEISISPAGETAAKGDVTLLACGPDNAVLASLPLRIMERTEGRAGVELTATDLVGSFRLRVRLSPGSGELKSDFHFKIPDGALPSQVVPTLRFISHVHPPNRIGFRFLGSDKDAAVSEGVEASPVPLGWVAVVEALDRIQSSTHVYFRVPDDFTREDGEKVLEVDRLLRGEPVEMTWGRMATEIVVGDPAVLATALQTWIRG